MKELIASIPVPPKMYRHFAVITLLITACIAIFADGERREAISEEITEQQNLQAMRRSDVERNGPQKIGQDMASRKHSGGFGAEGVEEANGSEANGQAVGIVTTDGRNNIQGMNREDMGVLQQSGGRDLGTGLYPSPIPKKGERVPLRKQPSAADRAKLQEAAAERAGKPSE